MDWKIAIAQRDEEIRRLRIENSKLRSALDTLARLGNGERLGNSDGNIVARRALGL